MNVNTTKIWAGSLLGLCLAFYSHVSMAFPLPTMDMGRLAQSAKTVKLQIDDIKQEIDSNMHIIKQIQNGGYAAAAKELFGKIQNGEYDRYGSMVSNLGATLGDAAIEAQAAAAKDEERKALNQKLAEREAARKDKEKKAAEAKAAQKQAENVTNAKQSAWKKAFNWVKKYGVTATDVVSGTVDAIGEGGSLTDVGKNIYDNVGSDVKNIASDMNEEQKEQQEAQEKAREEFQNEQLEDTKKKLDEMGKNFNDNILNDSLKQQGSALGNLGRK